MKFAFFGTGEIAVGALAALDDASLLPKILITAPDKPAGRGHVMTPPPAKEWAQAHGIEVWQPEKLDADFIERLNKETWPVFVVIDYGAFLPKSLLALPERGVLNMHPSLLPRLRGPSPIRSSILNDEKETGVTIMLVDEKMDHGPIVAQRKIAVPEWPPRGRELDALLATSGGRLLSEILPLWVRGDIEAQEQNHDVATYSSMFSKEDGLIDLAEDGYKNLLKIRAFEGWPGTHTFFEKGGKRIRVQILGAHVENNKLVLDTVKPEGKKEMSFRDFAVSGAKPALQ